jgi:hypothetical protein
MIECLVSFGNIFLSQNVLGVFFLEKNVYIESYRNTRYVVSLASGFLFPKIVLGLARIHDYCFFSWERLGQIGYTHRVFFLC